MVSAILSQALINTIMISGLFDTNKVLGNGRPNHSGVFILKKSISGFRFHKYHKLSSSPPVQSVFHGYQQMVLMLILGDTDCWERGCWVWFCCHRQHHSHFHFHHHFHCTISKCYRCWSQVILIAERGEAEFGFAAIDSITFKDLSEEPCETFPPQVTTIKISLIRVVHMFGWPNDQRMNISNQSGRWWAQKLWLWRWFLLLDTWLRVEQV